MTSKHVVYTSGGAIYKARLEKLESRILFYDDMYADMKIEVLEDMKLIDEELNFLKKEFKFTYRMMMLGLITGAIQFGCLLYLIGN
jgi:hypothetical protein